MNLIRRIGLYELTANASKFRLVVPCLTTIMITQSFSDNNRQFKLNYVNNIWKAYFIVRRRRGNSVPDMIAQIRETVTNGMMEFLEEEMRREFRESLTEEL